MLEKVKDYRYGRGVDSVETARVQLDTARIKDKLDSLPQSPMDPLY